MQQFDYVVVGGGSAGCAVAARLAQDGRTRVLLLESGPADRNIWIHIPIGYGKTMYDPRVNWQFKSEPEPHLNHRQIYTPRGRTLGGSSSINGLIYIRGQHEDFDDWRALGCEGWGFRDILPYFRRSERNDRGASEYHGADGPVGVSSIKGRHELVEAFIGAANAIGVVRNDDFNGAHQRGVGYFQLTTRGGLRSSTAKAYLRSGIGGKNLEIVTGTHAERVVFEGRRAVGVRYRAGGEIIEARATREVVLSAGTLQSPQLLMLSGIGDGEQLSRHGIPVLHDLPQVGRNLQDHLQARLMYKCSKPITTNDALRTVLGARAHRPAVVVAQGRPGRGGHPARGLVREHHGRRTAAGCAVPLRHHQCRHDGGHTARFFGLHHVGVPVASDEPRRGKPAICGPRGRTRRAVQLPVDRRRPGDDDSRRAHGAQARANAEP